MHFFPHLQLTDSVKLGSHIVGQAPPLRGRGEVPREGMGGWAWEAFNVIWSIGQKCAADVMLGP